MISNLIAYILIPFLHDIVLARQVNLSGGAERYAVKRIETINRMPYMKLGTDIYYYNETDPYWDSSYKEDLWLTSNIEWFFEDRLPTHFITHLSVARALRTIYDTLIQEQVPPARINKLLDRAATHAMLHRGPYSIKHRQTHIKFIALRSSHGGEVPLILWFSSDDDPTNQSPDLTPDSNP